MLKINILLKNLELIMHETTDPRIITNRNINKLQTKKLFLILFMR